ncbi:hypothetical protein [Morganella morganii]|uniref:hypothetical protein n=1 Tax=Morganella morganii TaxID=582 RepID=UPI00339CFE3B
MRMSDKIDWWKQIFRWLQNALPFIGSFSFSAAMAYIRERRMGSISGIQRRNDWLLRDMMVENLNQILYLQDYIRTECIK